MSQEDTNNTTDTQKLLSLMEKQNKELIKTKKKLELLENQYVKAKTNIKELTNDKTNIEGFLKNIFPKDMHDELIKEFSGNYDTSELSRLWLIYESKNQNEYQSILSEHKKRILELTEHNNSLISNLDEITNEYSCYKSDQKTNVDQLQFYMSRCQEMESLENEKKYLLKVLDEKNEEIKVLNSLELENAELKAQSLLDNFDQPSSSSYPIPNKAVDCFGNINKVSSYNTNDKTASNQLKITSLNIGCQTEAEVFSKEEVDALREQIASLQLKNNKMKKEFTEYKEKSHKILISNEESYKKILSEYETVKRELSQLLNEHNESIIANKNLMMQNKVNSHSINNSIQQAKANDMFLHQLAMNKNDDLSQKISTEYLKNILLKYLEALAIGDEFQSKILENVMFTMLYVSKNEKKQLEDKRVTSSFYYNLWFNAKAFLSSKIYGPDPNDSSKGNLNNNQIEESKGNDIQIESLGNKTSL